MAERFLLITGATGQQGGATVRALLTSARRWRLRALVRDPEAPRVQALASRGVEIVVGNLDDAASLRRAMDGAYGVFSVQTPAQGVEAEERQGKLVAAIASELEISHLVYSSVGGAERKSGVPHFESKWRIEQHIEHLGVPATILRPAPFMDNFSTFAFRTIILSLMKTYVPAARPMQMVAVVDIGAFAAMAFNDPGAYVGRKIELAGDALTRGETVRILRQAGRGPVIAFRFPGFMRGRLPQEYVKMFEWIAATGFEANIPALTNEHPGLLSLKNWSAV